MLTSIQVAVVKKIGLVEISPGILAPGVEEDKNRYERVHHNIVTCFFALSNFDISGRISI